MIATPHAQSAVFRYSSHLSNVCIIKNVLAIFLRSVLLGIVN